MGKDEHSSRGDFELRTTQSAQNCFPEQKHCALKTGWKVKLDFHSALPIHHIT